MASEQILRAKIQNRETLAKDTILIDFRLPFGLDFLPGQSFKVTLSTGDSRFFSFTNPPSENERLTTITRIRASAFKQSLNALPLGSEVEISNIGGVFLLPKDSETPLVFIAGGVGITPFLSMLEHIRQNGLPYKITLLYSNAGRASTVFWEGLKSLRNKIPGFKMVLTMTRDPVWIGEHGRIDQEFIKKHVENLPENIYMVSGKPHMTNSLFNQIADLGVDPVNIKTEEFTGY